MKRAGSQLLATTGTQIRVRSSLGDVSFGLFGYDSQNDPSTRHPASSRERNRSSYVAPKSAALVATELSQESQRLRQGTDAGLGRAKALMEHIPRPFLRLGARLAAWAVGERAWSLPKLGLPATPFGSAMVSSVGMLGLPLGFSPLLSLYRVPILILAGEISEQPVVVDGRVEAQPVLPITATVDHRYVDGGDLGRALKAFRAYLEAPAAFEPPDAAFTLASK